MIVTAHQPGYLPGVSVMSKVAHADAVVWLDDVRFSTPGWVNRNQLSDGTWLTVPVERENHRSTIREVTIAPGGSWRSDHVWTLRNRFMHCEHFDHPSLGSILGGELSSIGALLVDLNLELTEWIIGALGLSTREFRQSDYPAPGGSLSSKLARMVKEVGGTAYLSGPTSALDPQVFAREGVELLFFRYAGPNPSVVEPLFMEGRLPAGPLQEVCAA